jgi:RNA polymerase sigma factor (TIGR02999 family)
MACDPQSGEETVTAATQRLRLDARFREVYAELHAIARQRLGGLRRGETLQPTALVHEAYLRLLANSGLNWNDRGHFLALAAQAMRWIVVDHARRKRTTAALPDAPSRGPAASTQLDLNEILSLDEALSRLEEQDVRKAEVVLLRYFAGLSVEETAKAMSISPATVKREWNFARAWLQRTMRDDQTRGAK